MGETGADIMSEVAAVDWLIICLYLVGVIGFGVWIGQGQRTARDYFLGNRSIPWWGVGLSIVATETSALTFLGVPALAYGGDLALIQIVFGFALARLLLAAFLVPRYFAGEIYSPYQLLGQTFGLPARRTAGVFFLISGTLAAGVRVYVTCIPIQLLLDIPIGGAICLFVGLSLIYTYLGGIRAVVWTDAVQFFLFLAGGIFVLCYIPTLLKGGWETVATTAEPEGKFHWFNPAFALAMPYNIWMGLAGALMLALFSHGVDQLIVQRVLSCRSVAEGRKAMILSGVVILPLFILFLLVGVLLWVYYQFHSLPMELPEARPGVAQNDYLFPIFILTALPTGIKGLLIVGILSAAMSSVSSALSALASVSTMDFLKPRWGERRDEAFYFRWSRYSTLLWAALLILVAYLTQQVESVLNAAFSLNGLTSGAMLGGVLLALSWKGHRSKPVIIGMVTSLAVMIGLHAWAGERLAWPWYTPIGLVITLVVAVAVGRLCPPPLKLETT